MTPGIPTPGDGILAAFSICSVCDSCDRQTSPDFRHSSHFLIPFTFIVVVVNLQGPVSLEFAMANCSVLLENTAEQVIALFIDSHIRARAGIARQGS